MHISVPGRPEHVKAENPKGDRLSQAVHVSGMSQFVNTEYQTRWVVLLEIRASCMSVDQSKKGCLCNFHTQMSFLGLHFGCGC